MDADAGARAADRFAAWMATPAGRGLRIVAGIALIGAGLGVVRGVTGALLAVIGVVPIIAGLVNWCLLAPILRVPIRGADAQERCANRTGQGPESSTR